MIFGGSGSSSRPGFRPVGSRHLTSRLHTWAIGAVPARSVACPGGRRQVLVLGRCGAKDSDLRRLSSTLPDDITWKWPGTYTIIEESEEAVVIHTDPASARPIYLVSHDGGWVWSSSARALASLTRAPVDVERLACSIFLPSVPTLSMGRTFFSGVEQLPPGCRIVLPVNGGSPHTTTVWRPDPCETMPPAERLRTALFESVAERVRSDPMVSCDFSGGLDSTSIAALATVTLPYGTRLNAVTIHPEGDTAGADLGYARRAAAAYSGRINHRLLAMSAKHLPYTAMSTVPATDEPAPSTIAQARLTGQFRWLREEFGTRTHMTGDGGDSLLFQPPVHLADLIRHGRIRRAVSEGFGWAGLRRASPLPFLRDAVLVSRTSRTRALAELVDSVGGRRHSDHGSVGWFPLLPYPSWAGASAAALLRASARRAGSTPDQLPGLDASVRTLVDEVREVARSAVADAELAAAWGIDLNNPFLDPSVVDAVLRTPLDRRPPLHSYKPLLSSAMAGLLPHAVASRQTKGSFEADHYAGLRANMPELLELAHGRLAEMGLIDTTRLVQCLGQAAAGVPMSLAALEQALGSEAWLAAHAREPEPAWTFGPLGPRHD
ncbi:albusnodin/ikarugamycin family macrolactam cyclase [Streptomyces anulatus]|uniref:albusnodin/ikarugamycin family macrolactam cyclase n=1 Tax=Streptomyces anulatus TaxID=1892 RepID=UPI0038643966|nr:albusnodin/ikarugamycin family macrolactam cyclase [Streptomyces anulatus]WTE02743.1 albusnodin/ikarugamycin family macrolactam cyclase [Streptomyces anulatus]